MHQEEDTSPADEWLASLGATCNRLSTQYLQLLRAAAGTSSSLASAQHHDEVKPVSGGHGMTVTSLHDPPPPPLAADVARSSLQVQLAVENLCVAASQLLSLIRTLRLSALLMDTDTIEAEREGRLRHLLGETERTLRQAAQELHGVLQWQRVE